MSLLSSFRVTVVNEEEQHFDLFFLRPSRQSATPDRVKVTSRDKFGKEKRRSGGRRGVSEWRARRRSRTRRTPRTVDSARDEPNTEEPDSNLLDRPARARMTHPSGGNELNYRRWPARSSGERIVPSAESNLPPSSGSQDLLAGTLQNITSSVVQVASRLLPSEG
ncbi:unnamed protein product [Nezara viridula]|uniref:Uncharacterized protein n=1 Tax=Nezara viridula TaxID=85310 RepID=A0A9P0HRQ2_NEZVI|nr:unnamed protein product [Nezara viridula]